MNFDPFWAVNQNSDLLWANRLYQNTSIIFMADDYYSLSTPSFWKIAIPILAIVTPLALISDLKNLWLYFQHRGESKKAIRVSRVSYFFFISFLYCRCFVKLIKNNLLSSLINEHEWRLTSFVLRHLFPPFKVLPICSDTLPPSRRLPKSS